MKTSNLYLYLLQRYSIKKSVTGFTLIEVLVVMLILSILTAIALPTYLAYVNKARETEGVIYTSKIVDAQRMYFLEHNSSFAERIDELDVSGIKPVQYDYTINITKTNGVSTVAEVLATPNGQYRAIRGCNVVKEGEPTRDVYKAENPGQLPRGCDTPSQDRPTQ